MDPLASFEDLQKLSRVTWTEADQPAADALLASASPAVRSYCGWEISAVTNVVVVLDGPGGPVLALPSLHVTELPAVEILDRTGQVWSTVDDAVPSAHSGLVRRRWGRHWPGGYSSVRATYSGGYEPVPDDVKAIVASAVDRARTTPPGGVVQEQTGQVSRSYAPTAVAGLTLSTAERLALAPYRISRES